MINHSNKQPETDKLTLWDNAVLASNYTAKKIAELILTKQKEGKLAILGLATGNTPKMVYKELIRLHKQEGLSFSNVVSFNLDEYYPIKVDDEQSYTYFMNNNLFDHVDIKQENIHIPYTDCSLNDINDYCLAYENKIKSFGGLDLQLLGIGRNGHIGFNEPGSKFDSITRLIDLHPLTREDAIENFGDLDSVPHQAITMGIDTIAQAKSILLLALGERKAEIMKKALKGSIANEVPSSILQSLPQVEYILDREAAALIQK